MITYKDGQFVRVFHTIEEVKILTPDAFEYFSKYLLELLGYEKVKVSEKHGAFNADGGIDLFAIHNDKNVVGQCKHWNEGTGRYGYMPIEQIRALGGAMLKENAKEGVFISTLPFSKASKEFAASVNIRLIGPIEINEIIRKSPMGMNGGRWRLIYALDKFVKSLGLQDLKKQILMKLATLFVLILLIALSPYYLPWVFKMIMWFGNVLSRHLSQIKVIIPNK